MSDVPLSSQPSTTLRGWQLIAARAAWAVLVGSVLILFAVSIPLRYQDLADPIPPVQTELTRLGYSPQSYALIQVGLDVLFVAVCACVGIVVIWRKSDDSMVLHVGLMLVSWGAMNGLLVESPNALSGRHPAVDVLIAALSYVGYMSWMLFFYRFPTGTIVPRAAVAFALMWALFAGIWTFFPTWAFSPPQWPLPIFNAVIIMLWGRFLVTQVYRYACHSNPIQRQQTKWVVFGVATAVAGLLTTFFTLGAAIDLQPEQVERRLLSMLLSDLAVLLIPVTIGVAVLKHRLFEIDQIVNRAVVYGALSAILGAIYLGLVLFSQFALQSITPQSDIGLVFSTLVVAALFQPIRRRVQAVVDRRFYRHRYDATRTVAAFSAHARNEVDLETLRRELVQVVQQTLQPAHVSVWLRPLDQRRTGEP